jgi:hypothetical protein
MRDSSGKNQKRVMRYFLRWGSKINIIPVILSVAKNPGNILILISISQVLQVYHAQKLHRAELVP